MRQALKMKITVFIICIVAVSLLIPLSSIKAQQLTYRVEKGDTLWSICEKYYGDSDLWPKLWQMNPFITNPHFLNPGDVITLIEKDSLEKPADTAMKPATPEKPLMKGIDVSSLTKFEASGFLSIGRSFKPLGKIVSTDSSRLFLTKGDKVTVLIKDQKDIGPGTELNIAQTSPLIEHPRTGETLGYVVRIIGSMVVEKVVVESIYEAKITDSFKPISLDDLIIPFDPLSPCIEPIPADESLFGYIAAAKDQAKLVGQHSVVYLDLGLNQGVRRGNLFEVINTRTLPDPNFKGDTLTDYIKRKQIPLPNKNIGLLLILESRPENSTALIISASENFSVGAQVKRLSWVDRPEILSRIPPCALE
jgi:LysM repeat protein